MNLLKYNRYLVTGAAGFIGMHLSKKLLEYGCTVIGIDNMNDYYDPELKENRLNNLKTYKSFNFIRSDISSEELLKEIFSNFQPEIVVNLAAQAGVRYSLDNPRAYIDSNIVGFMNVLECCREYNVKGLIYASSSSVYGGNEKYPFSIHDKVENPLSIYAVTKKTNELMAKTYNHLYGMNTTGLRFFTVYGPWGRPDMAMFIFAQKILSGQTLTVFNHGKINRDFTYIDDIIEGILCAIDKNFKNEIFNLGNNKSEDIMRVIKIIEKTIGKKAKLNFEDIQPGDVKRTFADIDYTRKKINYKPVTSISEGIPRFINWFLNYRK